MALHYSLFNYHNTFLMKSLGQKYFIKAIFLVHLKTKTTKTLTGLIRDDPYLRCVEVPD